MAEIEEKAAAGASLPKRLLVEAAEMLRFYSRLPVPRLPFEIAAHATPDFRHAVRMLPAAAFILALPGALVIDLAAAVWLPAMLVALLGIAATMIVTGGLHEDGLADLTDGIGGGATIQRRLDIMRDSRIGAFGALALIVVVLAKIICLSTIIDRQGSSGAMLAFLAAAVASRSAALMPHWLLPAARSDGRAVEVGRPETSAVLVAALLTALPIILALRGFGLGKLLAAFILMTVAAGAMTLLARSKLGGHTGDVIGATQQVAEVTFLIALDMSFYA